MRTTTLQDRMVVLGMSKAGHKDNAIAQALGWSIFTVRKWRRRGKPDDPSLASHMGRPARGAMSTFCSSVHEDLGTRRQDHPGWGPKTLRAELEQDDSLSGQALPARATIARWLKWKGFTRRYERHRDLPQPPPASATSPHEEWEMDARGYEKVMGVGVVNLINLSDRFSRAKILSYPCWLGEERAARHPATADYQLVLRVAFTRWGLPDRLYVDRDSVFYDNLSKSPYPTMLHMWLLALGISLIFGPPGRPKERAIIERSHQTWAQQVLVGQSFGGWEALRDALMKRRDFLNEYLPCATLGEVPPLVAYPQARIKRRTYRPEWEADLLDLSRVHTYLSQLRWFRKGSNVGSVSLGKQVYVLGLSWARLEVAISFDATDQHFVFQTADGQKTKRLTAKGIAALDLIGDMGPLAGLDQLQLALPFTPHDWRVTRLCETLCDTTY